MKKSILILQLLFSAMVLCAQTDGMNYQAVILDDQPLEIPGQDLTGHYLAFGEVTLRFTIFDHNNEIIYQEVQSGTTDAYGLINMVIGNGEQTDGYSTFLTIDWDGMPKDLGVELSYDADAYDELSRQALLFIPYAFHRNITATGSLTVDGPTVLNNDLLVEGDATFNGNTIFNSIVVLNESDLQGDVNVGGMTTLQSDLDVAGQTTLNGSLTVNNMSPTNLSGDLTVDGSASIGNGLNVINGSSTTLSGNLDVDGVSNFTGNVTMENDLTVGNASHLNGQVTIDAGLTGTSDTDYGAYALRVEGANQGINVNLDGGRNSGKNFVTFKDAFGNHGAIEGQTYTELVNSFRFIWDFTMAGLDEGFAVAEAAACALNIPPDGWEVASNGAQAIAAYAQWIELTDYTTSNVGVLFNSGGADYAEWLERESPQELFFPGEVVGIFGGKISKNTAGAHEVKVVSTNPIVLGNKPEEGKESNFERVGFLGQVPVRVVGVVKEGDYILPSGKNDGLAIASSLDAIPTTRFNEIIGVAWEAGNSTGLNVVNVAIGLNTNDMATRVATLENELNSLKLQVENILRSLNGEDSAQVNVSPLSNQQIKENEMPVAVQVSKSIMTDEEFENWLQINESGFNRVMEEKRVFLESINSDYSRYPEVVVLLEDPTRAFREMRSGKYMESLWHSLEQRIQK